MLINKTNFAKYNQQLADDTTILYGGSCNPTNAPELFALPRKTPWPSGSAIDITARIAPVDIDTGDQAKLARYERLADAKGTPGSVTR